MNRLTRRALTAGAIAAGGVTVTAWRRHRTRNVSAVPMIVPVRTVAGYALAVNGATFSAGDWQDNITTALDWLGGWIDGLLGWIRDWIKSAAKIAYHAAIALIELTANAFDRTIDTLKLTVTTSLGIWGDLIGRYLEIQQLLTTIVQNVIRQFIGDLWKQVSDLVTQLVKDSLGNVMNLEDWLLSKIGDAVSWWMGRVGLNLELLIEFCRNPQEFVIAILKFFADSYFATIGPIVREEIRAVLKSTDAVIDIAEPIIGYTLEEIDRILRGL